MKNRKNYRGHNFAAFPGISNVGGMLGNAIDASNRGEIYALLQASQEKSGLINAQSIQDIAIKTDTAEAIVRGVASFYSMFEIESDEARNCERVVRVCDGPTCCMFGCEKLMEKLSRFSDLETNIRVARTSCLGLCDQAPAVLLESLNASREFFQTAIGKVDLTSPSLESLIDGCASLDSKTELLHNDKTATNDFPLTSRFELNESYSLETACSAGGYSSLQNVLNSDPFDVIEKVEQAELQGRGGAGFNAGRKWRMAAKAESEKRFVICNADESEPGTFKDRVLMENDPHLLIEGMIICAFSIGASKGYIYIRGEYSIAADRLERAIKEAIGAGFLGQDIQGTGFEFNISMHRGAGAYICGEETALLESLEGKRGEPRDRPPYPTIEGYLRKPTVVNNVETFCNIPTILNRGSAYFRNLGSNGAAGTKLYCLSGHIEHPGICEAPFGISLRQLIEDFGGGVKNDADFKFALTGGAAGTFVPASMLDTPLHYESWNNGVAVGSGAIIVADQTVNAATMLLWILRFFESESCGKCTPCRVGTVQAREIVEKTIDIGASPKEIDELVDLAKTLEMTSFCGLGQSASWPIKSAIKHFKADFEKII